MKYNMLRENTMDQLVNIELVSSDNTTNISNMYNINDKTANDKTANDKTANDKTANDITIIKRKKHFRNVIETCISVGVHTFIMAVFEIYFYFEYIIIIEKKMFMDKIDEYTIDFNVYYKSHITKEEHFLLTSIFPKKHVSEFLQVLYEDYQRSLKEQEKLLNELLMKAYTMLVIITSILILFFTIGICYKLKIHWKKIVIDNIFMFVSLGIFEYIFFVNIILHYSPVTDAEIKYEIGKNLLQPFLTNSSA